MSSDYIFPTASYKPLELKSFEEVYRIIKDHSWSPNKAEFQLMFDRVRAKKPKAILEIGTHTGNSAIIMHYAWPMVHITTVDPALTIEYGPTRNVGCDAWPIIPRDKITYICGKMGRQELRRTFDMCYIDGCHYMPRATLDFLYILPHCSSPFEFMTHDIEWAKEPGAGVENDGADYLWKVLKTLSTNIQRERYLGCCQLVFDDPYEFAAIILASTIVNGKLDTQTEKF